METTMTTPVQWGSDFLVSTSNTNDQTAPAVMALADGRFVAVWADASRSAGDMSDYAIRGQLFNADGSRIGTEFLVNSATLGDQSSPSVSSRPDGGFLVTWRSASTPGDTAGSGISGQWFDASGAKAGSEFRVNTTTDGGQFTPSAAPYLNGGAFVTWSDSSNAATTGRDIRGQFFGATGAKAGTEFVVNNITANGQEGPSVATLADGSVAIAWFDQSQATGDTTGAIRVRLFAGATVPLSVDILVNTTSNKPLYDPKVTGLADGGFVVAWTDHSESGGDTSGGAIRAQIFNADLTRRGGELLLNTTTAGEQRSPAVEALPDGNFVAVWYDRASASSDTDLRGQLFTRDGAKIGTEFMVGAPNGLSQDAATISVLPDGRFIVGFIEGQNPDIRAQIFDPRAGAVNLSGADLNDQYVGTRFADVLSGNVGSDTLIGDGGNDRLVGGLGDDLIVGGAGDDTAIFVGNFSQYAVSQGHGQIEISGVTEGFDVLKGVEHLQFNDGRIDLEDGSALFDTLFYVSNNHDVYQAGVNPLDHYNASGWREGRDPNQHFDTSGYLAVNRDVAAAGINPLDHYHNVGWREGRDPSATFDTTLYLINNSDVAAAGVDPLAHYLQYGQLEGRMAYAAVGSITSGFDAQYYLFHNPDVAAAGVDPLWHFNTVGWREHRDPNAYFSVNGYLDHYADVAAAGINPLWHYAQSGWREGRDASQQFDTLGYLAANPDVAAANVNPLDHFLISGIHEGRQAVNDGAWF
jgi:hypothetical protein